MIVRELLDVISEGKPIFIKPPGRRMYFDGIVDDVPERLMEVTVQEIVPQIYKNEDPCAVKRYYWGLGVWVAPIPSEDVLADAFEKEFKGGRIVIPDEFLRLDDGEQPRR